MNHSCSRWISALWLLSSVTLLALIPDAGAFMGSSSSLLADKLGLSQHHHEGSNSDDQQPAHGIIASNAGRHLDEVANPSAAANRTLADADAAAGGGGKNEALTHPIDEVPDAQQNCHADLSKNPPPQVVLVGAPKTGSTALYSKLCTHPNFQCELVTEKEPNTLRSLPKQVSRGDISNSTKELYEAYMARAFPGWRHLGAGNLTMDGSIWYYYHSGSRSLLRRLLPCSKLVFIVRNPIHRARSSYFHAISKTRDKNVEEHIKLDAHLGATCNRLVGQSWEDMAHGLSSRFLNCLEVEAKKIPGRSMRKPFKSMPHPLVEGYWIYYLQELRREHAVHVLVHEDLESNNDSVFGDMLDGLTRYLGIPPFVDRSPPKKIDIDAQAARSSQLFARNRKRAVLHPHTIDMIKPVLEVQTTALERLLGRKLGWSFDDTG